MANLKVRKVHQNVPKDPTQHLALLWVMPLEETVAKKPPAKPKPGKPPRKPRY